MERRRFHKKKLLTFLMFLYVGILIAAVTYATVTGELNFEGRATTTAHLEVVIDTVTRSAPTDYESRVISATPSADGKSMDIVVDLRAPGDMAYIVFDLINTGSLPAEFEAPVVDVKGVMEEPAADPLPGEPGSYELFPIIIEGLVDAERGILDFEDIDGYTLMPGISSPKFGMAFIWDEDTHIDTTNAPITFTVEFPYGIGEIAP